MIQLLSLAMFIFFLRRTLKAKEEIKLKSGDSYLGALKIGPWALPVLRFLLPFLLAAYSLAIFSLIIAIVLNLLELGSANS
jgi:hypothetical protein